MIDGAGRLHARQRADLLKQLAVERSTPPGRFFLRSSNGNNHGKDVVRVETRIDRLQRNEAANHQTRADQQNECQREFGGDEEASQAITLQTVSIATAAFF